jgi:hypothetical protein
VTDEQSHAGEHFWGHSAYLLLLLLLLLRCQNQLGATVALHSVLAD